VVSYTFFLPVGYCSFVEFVCPDICHSFPLEIVFRILDNCLANGIEAIFGFAISLLQKNEAMLLSLKFDDLVAFLNTGIVDTYKAGHDLFNTLRALVMTRAGSCKGG
jgi:hypothetical protein